MAKKPSAKTTRSTKSVAKQAVAPSESLLDILGEAVEEARSSALGTAGSQGVSTHLMSTGTAALDLLIGGGIPYGTWGTSAGLEGSAKSLIVTTMAGAAVRQNVPKVIYLDPEGSQESKWMRAAMRDTPDAPMFGKRDAKGNMLIRPRVDYSDLDVIEDAFKYMSKVLEALPDKIYDEADGKWYLGFDKKHPKIDKIRAALGAASQKHSKGKKMFFPTDDSSPQCVFVVDSWPCLNTSEEAAEGETSNALAVKARAFSKAIPLVRGRLKRKAAILMGVNQLRENPGVMYGAKTTEPCGQALKYASSLRIWMRSTSVPDSWQNIASDRMTCSEPSVEGEGEDKYVFKTISLKKSKLTSVDKGKEVLMRVWISDHHSQGRGVDPVYDAAEFLTLAGVAKWDATLNRKLGKHAVSFYPDTVHPLQGMDLSWKHFKTLILSEVFPSKRLTQAADEIWESMAIEKFPLYQWCFDNMVRPDSIDYDPDEEYEGYVVGEDIESTQDEDFPFPETDTTVKE